MKNFCEIDVHNIDNYYNRPDGNLYFKPADIDDADYEVVDGFHLDELKAAMAHGDIMMIWISGPALDTITELLKA